MSRPAAAQAALMAGAPVGFPPADGPSAANGLTSLRESISTEICNFVEKLLSERLRPERVELMQLECNTQALQDLQSENAALRQKLVAAGMASQDFNFNGTDSTVETLNIHMASDGTTGTGGSIIRLDSPPKEHKPQQRDSTQSDPGKPLPPPRRISSGMRSNGSAGSRKAKLVNDWISGSRSTSRRSTYSSLPAGPVARIVHHYAFDFFFNMVILVNCATLGLNAHGQVERGYNPAFQMTLDVAEHCFTALFVVELILRAQGLGLRSFWPLYPGGWGSFLDALLVLVTGIVPAYILPLLALVFNFESDSDVIQAFTVLRAVRLLRLVRVVQRSPLFHEAWLLIRGLTDSFRTLWWTCVVIFFITYIFAVFGLVLISRQLQKMQDGIVDQEELENLKGLMEYVGGLDVLMSSLIQVLTLDSWNGLLVKPVMHYLPWAWLYFYAYIALAVFVLMNLVTAIIVDNAVTNSRMDEDQALMAKEKSKSRELKELEQLFILMDADQSGTLSWDEFQAAFEDETMAKKWKLLDFGPEDCREVFELLDDGAGEIETREFFDGLERMKGSARSKDLFRVAKTQQQLYNLLSRSMGVLNTNAHYPSPSTTGLHRTAAESDRVHVPLGVMLPLPREPATVSEETNPMKLKRSASQTVSWGASEEISPKRETSAVRRSNSRGSSEEIPPQENKPYSTKKSLEGTPGSSFVM